MNDLGICTLWVKDEHGSVIGKPQYMSAAEQERQVVILQVVLESGVKVQTLFRREDFSRMLAFPNDADPVEVAMNIEEEADE